MLGYNMIHILLLYTFIGTVYGTVQEGEKHVTNLETSGTTYHASIGIDNDSTLGNSSASNPDDVVPASTDANYNTTISSNVTDDSLTTYLLSNTTEEDITHTEEAMTSNDNENVCELEPCLNGGVCLFIVDSAGYQCNCKNGYVGKQCETKDYCEKNDDKLCEGGACVYNKDSSSRSCKCFDGKSWDHIRRICRGNDSPCFPSPCLNSGICHVQDSMTAVCVCPRGYIGDICDIEDHCDVESGSVNCSYGKCIIDSTIKKNICVCDDGYHFDSESSSCKFGRSPCDDIDCGEYGQCVAKVNNNAVCICEPGYAGTNCDIRDECYSGGRYDACRNGECALDEEKKLYHCACSAGYFLQHTRICLEIVKPCQPSPCGNNHLCSPQSNEEYQCMCSLGYEGPECDLRNKCILDGGNDFCANAACVMNYEFNAYFCKCAGNEYFDYNNRMCKALDLCPLMECGEFRICKNSQCKCKFGYRFSNNSKSCVPDSCANYGCPIDDMICTESDDISDPLSYACSCKDGFSFNGTHCTNTRCSFPTLNDCVQTCEETDENYQCGCFDGYTLSTDNKTCLETVNLTCNHTSCGGGYCTLLEGTEVCQCPPGYTVSEENCVDRCTAGEIPSGICSADRCEPTTDGFRCRCDGKYRLSFDGVTCISIQPCAKGNYGYETCEKKNAECIIDESRSVGFKCSCPYGYELDTSSKTCKRICDIMENKRYCLDRGALCYANDNGVASCQCPPGLTLGKDGFKCNTLAEKSYILTLPLSTLRYAIRSQLPKDTVPQYVIRDTSIDVSAIEKDVKISMASLYEELKTTNVLSCTAAGNHILCKVELQFKEIPDNVNRVKCSQICVYNETVLDDGCILPPNLLLKKSEISAKMTIRESDPCDGELKVAPCGEGSACVSSKTNKNFVCKCKNGYKAINVIHPVANVDSFVEICIDADECLEGGICPPTTTCVNTVGSYKCECRTGFRPRSNTSVPSSDGCVELCSPNPCVFGVCQASGPHHFECRCNDGYTGSFCNFEDKKFKAQKTKTIIVGSVLGGILLIVIILFAASVTTLRARAFLNEKQGRDTYGGEMTERVSRMSATNAGYETD